MTRRGWLLLWGVGLSSGVISACTHTIAGGDVRASRPNERQALAEALERKPTAGTLTAQSAAEAQEVKPAPAPPVVDLLPPERPPAPKPEPRPEPPAPPVKPPEAAATTRPAPVKEPPLVTALRYYLDGRGSAAYQLLNQYPQENQELLIRLLPLLERLTKIGPEPAAVPEWEQLLGQLNVITTQLQARATLTIEKLCFIDGCSGFGMYEPTPGQTFRPGQQVNLYVEVRNFSNTENVAPGGRKTYKVELAGQIEIRDYTGHTRKTMQIEKKRYLSQSPRHDFYDVYGLYLPAELTPGRYTLALQLVDVETRRAAKVRTVDFQLSNERLQTTQNVAGGAVTR